jgi:hypothetical protein
VIVDNFRHIRFQSIEYIMGFCPAYDFFIGSLTAQAGSFSFCLLLFRPPFHKSRQASSSSGLSQSCLRTGTNQHADSWALFTGYGSEALKFQAIIGISRRFSAGLSEDFRGTGDVSEAAEPNGAMSCKTQLRTQIKRDHSAKWGY